MYVGAPGDKKGNAARINWLLRQLTKDGVGDLYLRAQWPATSPWTQASLVDAHQDSSPLYTGKGNMVVGGFEVVKVVDLGVRFSRPRVFIEELEAAVPNFYEQIGQNLQPWVKPAPKVKEERLDPEAVSPSSISD